MLLLTFMLNPHKQVPLHIRQFRESSAQRFLSLLLNHG